MTDDLYPRDHSLAEILRAWHARAAALMRATPWTTTTPTRTDGPMTELDHDTDPPTDTEDTDPGGHEETTGDGSLSEEAKVALYVTLLAKVARARDETRALREALDADRERTIRSLARIESTLADVVGNLEGAIGQWQSLGTRVTALESRVDRLEATG